MRISKGSLRRAARKEAAAKSTGWNTYSVYDFEAVKKRVAARLPKMNDDGQKAVAARAFRQQLKFLGGFTRYPIPHQGNRECARRIRQNAAA